MQKPLKQCCNQKMHHIRHRFGQEAAEPNLFSFYFVYFINKLVKTVILSICMSDPLGSSVIIIVTQISTVWLKPCIGVTPRAGTDLPRSTLGSIQWWAFLGLAEERVVVVAAPQLFAGVMGHVLETKKKQFCKNVRLLLKYKLHSI